MRITHICVEADDELSRSGISFGWSEHAESVEDLLRPTVCKVRNRSVRILRRRCQTTR
jgi:hypothetical protein